MATTITSTTVTTTDATASDQVIGDKGQFDTITNEAGTGAPSATYGISFPAGQGLDFSASAGGGATSSVLNDYEKGAFTPVIIGETTSGTGTYSTVSGFYTKIGSLVTVTIFIQWSAHTGTGNLKLSGLPYPSVTNGWAGFANHLNPTLGNKPITGRIDSNASTASQFYDLSGTQETVQSTGKLEFSVSYITT